MSEGRDDIDWSVTTWDGSRRAQLRHALTLTLRERMEAVEGLADVARRFQEMRARGQLRTMSEPPGPADSMSRAAVNALLEHPKRHPVTTQEFLRMGEAGVFAPDSRLELIGGEIVEMAPIGSAHAGTVAILTRLFGRAAGERALVWAQNPIIVSDRSVPQPDVALLRPRLDSYTRSHPAVADTLLVVEVSDTTLDFDLNTRAPLYGRCGVPELWVVDLAARIVRVHRDPGDAGYATVFTASAATGLEPVLMPGARIALEELFP